MYFNENIFQSGYKYLKSGFGQTDTFVTVAPLKPNPRSEQ